MKKLWNKMIELADEGGSLFVIIVFFSIFLIGIPYLIYKTGYLVDILIIIGGVTFGILALFVLFIYCPIDSVEIIDNDNKIFKYFMKLYSDKSVKFRDIPIKLLERIAMLNILNKNANIKINIT